MVGDEGRESTTLSPLGSLSCPSCDVTDVGDIEFSSLPATTSGLVADGIDVDEMVSLACTAGRSATDLIGRGID
jgi:hypothetical protein